MDPETEAAPEANSSGEAEDKSGNELQAGSVSTPKLDCNVVRQQLLPTVRRTQERREQSTQT